MFERLRPVAPAGDYAAMAGEHFELGPDYRVFDDPAVDVDVDDENGRPLIRLRRRVLGRQVVQRAAPILLQAVMASRPTNRGTAVGNRYKGDLIRRSDGAVSGTNAVDFGKYLELEATRATVLGYQDRNARFPFCRPCAFDYHHPEAAAVLLPLYVAISEVYREVCPDQWARQKAYWDGIHGDFRLAGTVFTSVTVNRNFRTALHVDAGDFREGMGVLSAIRRGRYLGGETLFPRYRAAVQLFSGDVLLANVHEWHCNAPMVSDGGGPFDRIALVLYLREAMIHCGSAEEELLRARSGERKTT